MAACHYCGAAGASERREVQTGHSKYYGSRSTSSRYSYSMRSVCGPCAKEVDTSYWRQQISKHRLSVAGLILLAGFLVFCIFAR
ncbi:hypothetical protein SAMN04515668_2513 [Hymenobacter arizonensis]|uniref:Uncharacterized protein n=1 Tax=Hymenobacter arizonensis TaxID=1227077 RepID=A0A1I5YWY2_HYMAR|nr:hypothetical protein SAMN04515668_2513 [Hymenobacter arizonensis]